MRCALVTGITGQDGSYLAELLLDKGYRVHGIVRRTSMLYTYGRLDHIKSQINLTYGDLHDGSSLSRAISQVFEKYGSDLEVFEIYNLGAQTHVKVSFDTPEYTTDVDATGVLRVLEVIRCLPDEQRKKTRFYQAGTSEMFGAVMETPQTETTPFNPVSPYACAKVYAHYITRTYRESYGIHACNGILFNHESPRRGKHFVTKKVADGVRAITDRKQECIVLGNLDSTRDWGHSKDYVRGMWMMLQQETPRDYVLATGYTTSVREFVERCFSHVGMQIAWKGKGIEEVGYRSGDPAQTPLVRVSEDYFRPCEVDALLGDSTKARTEMGWIPESDLTMLVRDMMENDM